MFRMTSLVLGLALLATSVSAAEIKVSTQNKSVNEVRVAVSDAAFKACKQAYADDLFAVYERDTCVRDSVASALSKADTNEALAKNGLSHSVVLASR